MNTLIKQAKNRIADVASNAPDGIRKAPQHFRNVPDKIRNAPDGIRKAPQHFRNVPDEIRNTSSGIRNAPDGIRNTPQHFRKAKNLPKKGILQAKKGTSAGASVFCKAR